MPRPKDEIISDIDDHIHRSGGSYATWYVGMAKDPRGPLFISHAVEDKDDAWMYREAFTPWSARTVVEYFQNLGASNGEIGSIEEGRFVYVYKKVGVVPHLLGKND